MLKEEEKTEKSLSSSSEAHCLIGRLIAAVLRRTISAAIDYDPNHFIRLSSVLFMIALYRLVMPVTACAHRLRSSAGQHNTHEHKQLIMERIKDQNPFIFFLFIPSFSFL